MFINYFGSSCALDACCLPRSFSCCSFSSLIKVTIFCCCSPSFLLTMSLGTTTQANLWLLRLNTNLLLLLWAFLSTDSDGFTPCFTREAVLRGTFDFSKVELFWALLICCCCWTVLVDTAILSLFALRFIQSLVTQGFSFSLFLSLSPLCNSHLSGSFKMVIDESSSVSA